jgi:hypothetical protein
MTRVLTCPCCHSTIKITDVADLTDLDYLVCKKCKLLLPIEAVPSQTMRRRISKTPPTWKVGSVRKSGISLDHKG